MGCCGYRKESQLKIEETLILPFESSLKLKEKDFKDLYSRLKDFSDKGFISYLEVSRIFLDLEIPFQEIFQFYDQFDRIRSKIVTEKRFSYFQLQSFALIMCKGDARQKVASWFELYDEGKKQVTSVKVDEMIQNLLKVVIDFISCFVCKKHKKNPTALKYEKLVLSGKDVLAEELSQKIRARKNVISKKEFKANLLRNFKDQFFSAFWLRDRAYYYGLNGGVPIGTSIAQFKRPPSLSFDDLSDFSYEIEKDFSEPGHNRNISNISIFSAEESTKHLRENLRYTSKGDKRFSILENENDGDTQNEKLANNTTVKLKKTEKNERRNISLDIREKERDFQKPRGEKKANLYRVKK